MGINRTYFDQLGLRISRSKDRLSFFLKRDIEKLQRIVPAEVNGASFYPTSAHFQNASRISIAETTNGFTVSSSFTTYTINGVSLNSIYRHHPDFSVTRNKIQSYRQFTGVLGRTFSKSNPHLIRKTDSENEKKKVEMKMRELYTVPEMLPSTKLLKTMKFVEPKVNLL